MKTLPLSQEKVRKNEEISDKLECLSLKGVFVHLGRKHSIFDIRETKIPLRNLLCTQSHYSEEKYEYLDEDPSILQEPLIVVNPSKNENYLYVGHIRAKKMYDNSIERASVYQFQTLDDSAQKYLEGMYNNIGRKKVPDLEPA